MRYSKHLHIRTYDFGVQADQVLIYLVLSEKSA